MLLLKISYIFECDKLLIGEMLSKSAYKLHVEKLVFLLTDIVHFTLIIYHTI